MNIDNSQLTRYEDNNNVWLSKNNNQEFNFIDYGIVPTVLSSEAEVGRAMLNELYSTAASKEGDINIALLGGRGAQELHRLLGALAKSTEQDQLLARLNVFTQDALAPLSMNNGFSFVRDFERILGDAFFKKIKSFTPMRTDTKDLELALIEYLTELEDLGGLDIFFIGHGPEENQASHLAYIKPFSGAQPHHIVGVIPISGSILEHHISKFKAGGSLVNESDEKECRSAEYILTLGPAAILQAKKIVQSVVDADSAPAKIQTYANVLHTDLSSDKEEALLQLNTNPGLWIRLHPNTKSFVLPNLGL
jgi:6-phosphogluconolactonase/glucosamine-6-phosphate isomerase/deaminase